MTVGFALAGGAWTFASRLPAEAVSPSGRPPAPQVGHLAPDFTATTLSGETLTLSALRGRPVVLNFWATWCGPCRSEIPHFEAIWTERAGVVMIIGVDVNESPGQVAAFAEQFNMTYPIPLDPHAQVASLYHVLAFPTTFLIDAQGVIREITFGAVNRAALDSRLANLLGP